MTDFSWQSKLVTRALQKTACTNCWSKPAASISPSCTRTNMLRAFFVIFVLCMVAMVAVLGFRGQKSTQPPTEVFPDMVRQPKVRAQAPLDFFADGRGPRLPVAGTVPVGYEMPKSKTE